MIYVHITKLHRSVVFIGIYNIRMLTFSGLQSFKIFSTIKIDFKMKLYPDSIILLSKNFNFLTYINLFSLFFYIYSLQRIFWY